MPQRTTTRESRTSICAHIAEFEAIVAVQTNVQTLWDQLLEEQRARRYRRFVAERMSGSRSVLWHKARAVLVLVLAMMAFVSAGCGSSSARTRPTTELVTTSALADVPKVRVFDEPGGSRA